MRTHDRLRIAIQKSGRLSGPARDLLAQAGFAFREDRDRLYCHGEGHPVDLLLVRDDDIPGLIADGVCDLGIVGRNVADEQAILDAQPGDLTRNHMPAIVAELGAQVLQQVLAVNALRKAGVVVRDRNPAQPAVALVDQRDIAGEAAQVDAGRKPAGAAADDEGVEYGLVEVHAPIIRTAAGPPIGVLPSGW